MATPNRTFLIAFSAMPPTEPAAAKMPLSSRRVSGDMLAATPDERTRANGPQTWRPSSDLSETPLSRLPDRIDQAASPEHAFELFRQAVADLGYDRVALIPVTPAAQEALGLTKLAPVISINVPDAWVRHYIAEEYQAFDPVLLQTPLQSGPLVWDDILTGERLSPKQRRILIESREAGMFNGVSIPLHGPRGETYVVSLAAERAVEPHPEHHPTLQLLAAQFLIAYSRVKRRHAAGPDGPRITDRERECLTWTARGKSAWAIGKILGVSEHTVNFHLKQSMAKLGASNRMQAVVAALRLGLILP